MLKIANISKSISNDPWWFPPQIRNPSISLDSPSVKASKKAVNEKYNASGLRQPKESKPREKLLSDHLPVH